MTTPERRSARPSPPAPRAISRSSTAGCPPISERIRSPGMPGTVIAFVIPLRDNIPTARPPVVTIAIIVANVLVYFFWQRGGLTLGDPSSAHYMNHLIDYGAIPYEITHPGDHCELVQNGAVACEGQAGVRGAAGPQPATWITPFTAMFMHG